jgi:hypothetical protein
VAQVGDVIRIKDVQQLTGVSKELMNVYYFRVLAAAGSPVLNNLGPALVDWWTDAVLPDLLEVQSAGLTHVRLEIDNLMDFEDEFVVVAPPAPVAGVVAGDYSGPSNTYSMQFNRALRTTRNGRKSLAGVPDTAFAGNVVAPAVVELLMSFGDTVVAPPAFDNGTGVTMTFAMVIAKTPVPPATLPTIFNDVTGATFRGLGSQTSRKQLLG